MLQQVWMKLVFTSIALFILLLRKNGKEKNISKIYEILMGMDSQVPR